MLLRSDSELNCSRCLSHMRSGACLPSPRICWEPYQSQFPVHPLIRQGICLSAIELKSPVVSGDEASRFGRPRLLGRPSRPPRPRPRFGRPLEPDSPWRRRRLPSGLPVDLAARSVAPDVASGLAAEAPLSSFLRPRRRRRRLPSLRSDGGCPACAEADVPGVVSLAESATRGVSGALAVASSPDISPGTRERSSRSTLSTGLRRSVNASTKNRGSTRFRTKV